MPAATLPDILGSSVSHTLPWVLWKLRLLSRRALKTRREGPSAPVDLSPALTRISFPLPKSGTLWPLHPTPPAPGLLKERQKRKERFLRRSTLKPSSACSTQQSGAGRRREGEGGGERRARDGAEEPSGGPLSQVGKGPGDKGSPSLLSSPLSWEGVAPHTQG